MGNLRTWGFARFALLHATLDGRVIRLGLACYWFSVFVSLAELSGIADLCLRQLSTTRFYPGQTQFLCGA